MNKEKILCEICGKNIRQADHSLKVIISESFDWRQDKNYIAKHVCRSCMKKFSETIAGKIEKLRKWDAPAQTTEGGNKIKETFFSILNIIVFGVTIFVFIIFMDFILKQ